MPLCLNVQNAGHRCTVIVLVIGALGLVHKRYVPGLQKLGFSKPVGKAIAKYLSISSMIGSRRISSVRWISNNRALLCNYMVSIVLT